MLLLLAKPFVLLILLLLIWNVVSLIVHSVHGELLRILAPSSIVAAPFYRVGAEQCADFAHTPAHADTHTHTLACGVAMAMTHALARGALCEYVVIYWIARQDDSGKSPGPSAHRMISEIEMLRKIFWFDKPNKKNSQHKLHNTTRFVLR